MLVNKKYLKKILINLPLLSLLIESCPTSGDIMILFLDKSRSLTEPHSSLIVRSAVRLMSSIQCARDLPLFPMPPPDSQNKDYSKLFSLLTI